MNGTRTNGKFFLLRHLGVSNGHCTLSKTRELRLIREARQGNQKSLEILLGSHIGYVSKIAGEYRRMGLQDEDLLAEAVLGFLEAVRRFKPKYKSRFITYAYWWIRKNILLALSRETSNFHIPHDILQKYFHLLRAENQLFTRQGYRPTREEVARLLDIPPRQVDTLREISQYRRLWSEDTKHGGRKVNQHPFRSNGSGQNPLSLCLRKESRKRLDEIFSQLPKREKWVLRKRFGLFGEKSLTLQKIASNLRLSKERVRQIESRAVRRVRELFESDQAKVS